MPWLDVAAAAADDAGEETAAGVEGEAAGGDWAAEELPAAAAELAPAAGLDGEAAAGDDAAAGDETAAAEEAAADDEPAAGEEPAAGREDAAPPWPAVTVTVF